MKKTIKKVSALVIAMLMTLAMVVPAFAATGGISLDGVVTNLSAEDANKHEYKVYQIFTGDLVGGKLQNVKYGANYGDTGASVPKTVLDTITDAKAFAATAEANLKGNPIATLTSANNFAVTGLPEGYYLVVDDTAKTLSQGDAYSNYIIQVLDTVENLKVKKEVPTGDKVISADTLGTQENTYANGKKVDNVSIGDTVTFKLTATVPTTAADYDYYFFILNDTLDPGLTFNKADAAITVTASTKGALAETTDYAVYTGTDAAPHTFEIAMVDAKSLAGQTITVTYKATLNENAKLFDQANPNKYDITYSNDPKHNYNGDKDNDKPGKPDSTKVVPTGKTPEKTTETFSSGIKIRKVDQDGQALKGAKFTIEGDSVEKIVHYTEAFTAAADGTYWKLTNGTYTDQAPQTEDTMIAAASGATDGYVVWAEGDAEEAITVGGTKYRVVRANETPTHILKKKNSELYDSTETKYKKTSTKTVEDSTNHKSATLTVEDDGTLTFDGLGAGTYTITEVEAPQGYTKAQPFDVTITFTENPAAGESHWTATGANKDADGYFTVDVINVAGNTLPSTGGMGTTIFYVIGGLLVLAAAIILISRRRVQQ